jgi:hypothetical protein
MLSVRIPGFSLHLMAICEGAEQELRLAFITDITLHQNNEWLSELLCLFHNSSDHSIRHFLAVCRHFQPLELIAPFHAALDDDPGFLVALPDIVLEDEEFASPLRCSPFKPHIPAQCASSHVSD